MTVGEVIAILTELVTLIGVLIGVFKTVRKISGDVKLIANGTKCQLRTEMLNIYYANRATKTIKQYEIENFIKLFDAYSVLGGNSFINRIYDEVLEWEVIQ